MSTSSRIPKEPLPLPPLGVRAESEKTSWAWRNPPDPLGYRNPKRPQFLRHEVLMKKKDAA